MAFHFPQKVFFMHCDPAGIVFFPRYFEIINDVNEAFFASLGHPYHEMMPENGVPTAEISTRFAAPSRHGDDLVFSLTVTKVGRSSVGIRTVAHAGDELRLETTLTLVWVNREGRPQSWPDDLRAGLTAHLEGDDP